MTSLIGKIAEDIAEYEWLCMKYDEEIKLKQDAYGKWLPDCYNPHAFELKKRHLADINQLKEEQ